MSHYQTALFKLRVISGTTSATANTETAHAHGLGVTPKFYVPLCKKSASIYQSKVPDATNIYLKSASTNVGFDCLVVAW